MSGEAKKGLFGRLFGGSKEQQQVSQADVSTEEKDGVPAASGVDRVDEMAGESAADVVDAVAVEAVAGDDTPASVTPEGNTPENNEPATAVTENEAVSSAPASADGGEAPAKGGWFSRLKSGLAKSSSKLTDGITSIFTKSKLDDQALEDLEDLLIQSDLGVAMAMRITDRLSSTRYDKAISGEEVRMILAEEITAILNPVAQPLVVSGNNKPHILLMVGVNGAGKTTTIGKLAEKFRSEGKSVMLAAGDTFRAAAIDQLKVWGERTGAKFVSGAVGADASGLVYDALSQAQEQQIDVLMIDTAGRLQNKTHLMDELEKIVRVIKKFDPNGPHDVLLTLDATTGQNALNQVEIFQKTAGVTGLVMTKLDGSARGGILVAIADKFKLPIHAIGVGEAVMDMQPFEPDEFARAIADIETEKTN